MWKIEIATNIGDMHCLWNGELALEFIRATLSKEIRGMIARLNAELSDVDPEGFKLDELQLETALDEDVKRAEELISELAPQAFWEAQARIVVDVMLILLRDQTIKLVDPEGRVSHISKLKKTLIREFRDNFARDFKQLHHARLGVQRGREAGKLDSKPRTRRKSGDAQEYRKLILAAIRELGTENISHKNLGLKIGKSAKTISAWLTKIKTETGENLDDLTVTALERKP